MRLSSNTTVAAAAPRDIWVAHSGALQRSRCTAAAHAPSDAHDAAAAAFDYTGVAMAADAARVVHRGLYETLEFQVRASLPSATPCTSSGARWAA